MAMTQIKICGITNKRDAVCAAQCGASALGFIFYPPSPRYIKPEEAKKIIDILPDSTVKVGVFVNETPDNIKKTMKTCTLDMIQLHGDETPEYCRQFSPTLLIKAIALNGNEDIDRALAYDAAALLIDTRHAGLFGGTGKKSNWDLACELKAHRRLILSGGLNAENVTDALKIVVPDALDINSGVEVSPGKKDHGKLASVFDIIRMTGKKSGNTPLIFQKRDK